MSDGTRTGEQRSPPVPCAPARKHVHTHCGRAADHRTTGYCGGARATHLPKCMVVLVEEMAARGDEMVELVEGLAMVAEALAAEVKVLEVVRVAWALTEGWPVGNVRGP